MSATITLQDGADAPALQALKAGDLTSALSLLQAQIRQNAANPRLRIFLFQLLIVMGQWDRALNQLKVVSELDASALPMVQTCRELIPCELLREAVFAGEKVPMLFGEPEPWVAMMVEALLLEGRGQPAQAMALRGQALEAAPASSGQIDGAPFEWLIDGDTRLGPIVEAVIQGRYYWVPINRLSAITLEAPTDLRDRVWTPAHLTFSNGSESVAFIPTRYPGSAAAGGTTALAQRTDWTEAGPDAYTGSGQRMWFTQAGESAQMDVRAIVFDGTAA